MEVFSVDSKGKLLQQKRMPTSLEKKIEDFLETHSTVLEKELMIIGRQVRTDDNEIVDLIGLNKQGDVVIIELKKDQTPRKVITQILNYAVWAEAKLNYDSLNNIAKSKHLKNHHTLMEKFVDWTGEIEPEFNTNQKLYVVAEEIDSKTANLAKYLRRKGIDIFCIELKFFKKSGELSITKRVVVGSKVQRKTYDDKSYSEQSHFDRKGGPESIALYKELKRNILKLGNDIRVNPVKNYIGFIRKGNFVGVRLRKKYLRCHLITSKGFDDPKKISKVVESGKLGGRLRRVSLMKKSEIPDLMYLIRQNYENSS